MTYKFTMAYFWCNVATQGGFVASARYRVQ